MPYKKYPISNIQYPILDKLDRTTSISKTYHLSLITNHSKNGFTLIELLIVVSIIAILSVIGFVNYQIVTKNGRDAKRQSDLALLQSALEHYRVDQGFYPTAMTLSTRAVFNSGTGNPSPPSSVKTYVNLTPIDPLSSKQYQYRGIPNSPACNNTTSKCTSHCLYASMDNPQSLPPAPANCPVISGYDYVIGPP